MKWFAVLSDDEFNASGDKYRDYYKLMTGDLQWIVIHKRCLFDPETGSVTVRVDDPA